MDYQVVEHPPFQVMGIELQTSKENSRDLSEIAAHWERFYTESTPSHIPNQVNGNILGLYTDYKGKTHQDYSLVIGCQVEEGTEPPKGFVLKEVSASKYAHFSLSGTFPDSLVEVWEQINASKMPRTYAGDFEQYGPYFHPEKSPHFDLFISIQ